MVSCGGCGGQILLLQSSQSRDRSRCRIHVARLLALVVHQIFIAAKPVQVVTRVLLLHWALGRARARMGLLDGMLGVRRWRSLLIALWWQVRIIIQIVATIVDALFGWHLLGLRHGHHYKTILACLGLKHVLLCSRSWCFPLFCGLSKIYRTKKWKCVCAQIYYKISQFKKIEY